MNDVERELRYAPYMEERLYSGASSTSKVKFASGRFALKKRSRLKENDASVQSYELAQWMGFGRLVPITVARLEGEKRYSFMEWRRLQNGSAWISTHMNYEGLQTKSLLNAVLFDMVINHRDRHNANWLVDSRQRVVLIDNETGFNGEGSGTYSVYKMLIGHPITDGHIQLLTNMVEKPESWPLGLKLFSSAKQAELVVRVQALLDAGTYF